MGLVFGACSRAARRLHRRVQTVLTPDVSGEIKRSLNVQSDPALTKGRSVHLDHRAVAAFDRHLVVSSERQVLSPKQQDRVDLIT